jgi:hypothetical protein
MFCTTAARDANIDAPLVLQMLVGDTFALRSFSSKTDKLSRIQVFVSFQIQTGAAVSD